MSTYELELMASIHENEPLRKHQLVAPAMIRAGNRGLVIYHDMGSGKTVTAAECIMEAWQRMPSALVLVMTKASLKESFRDEVFGKFRNRYKALEDAYILGNQRILDYERGIVNESSAETGEFVAPYGKKSGELHFVSHNAGSMRLLSFIENLEGKSLDNVIVIVDEAHELINGIKSAENFEDPRYKLYLKFMEAEKSVLVFLTGTIAVNFSKEVAILYNMVRGYFRKDLRPYNKHRDIAEPRMTLFPYTPGDDSSALEFRSYISRTPLKFGMRIAGLTTAYSPSYEIDTGTFAYRDTGFYPETKIIVENVPMTEYQMALHNVIDTIESEKKRKKILDINGNPMLSDETKEFMISQLYRSFEYSHAVCNFATPPILRPAGETHVLRIQYLSDTLTSKEFDIDRYVTTATFGKSSEKVKKRAAKFMTAARSAARKFVYANDTSHRSDIFVKCVDLLFENDLMDLDIVEKLFSSKFARIVHRIIKTPGKHAVFTSMVSYEGYYLLARMLDAAGVTHTVYETGEQSELDKYNAESNDTGKEIKVMFLTPKAVAGINLKCVRTIHMVENFWNAVRHKQAIARAIRLGSHDRLAREDRDVTVYKYTAVFSYPRESDGSLGTDDLMRRISFEKQHEIDQLETIIREFAIDRSMYTGIQVYPAMTGPVYRGDWNLDRVSDNTARFKPADARIFELTRDGKTAHYISVHSKLRTGESAILLSLISEPEFRPRMAIVTRDKKDILVVRRRKVFEEIGGVSMHEKKNSEVFGQSIIVAEVYIGG